ncbi:MAG: hypothetical protein AAGH92_06610 [Planctomycetota bacterium]
MIHDLLNLGAAGLMGVLWTWERMMSRQRERQLTEAHERLISHRSEIAALTDLAERNTRAITHFDETQASLRQWLEVILQTNRRESGDIFPSQTPPITTPGYELLVALQLVQRFALLLRGDLVLRVPDGLCVPRRQCGPECANRT